MHKLFAACGALLVAGLLAAAPAAAVTLGFSAICEDAGNAAMVGEDQFFVDLEEVDSDTVSFTFRNTGPEDSVISEIYFDDGYFTFASFLEGPGVDYETGAEPPDLPAGESILPPFDTNLSFQAAHPSPHNGIGPDERLTIILNLDSGVSFADVLADLTGTDLRIGLHAQGFDNDESCSFVNNPIPVPGAVWLLGSGLAGLIGLRRKLAA
jgi:hypothetical protein